VNVDMREDENNSTPSGLKIFFPLESPGLPPGAIHIAALRAASVGTPCNPSESPVLGQSMVRLCVPERGTNVNSPEWQLGVADAEAINPEGVECIREPTFVPRITPSRPSRRATHFRR
jgi:hypothetical protein